MKKTLLILLIYSAVIFASCIVFSFIYGHIPSLLLHEQTSYKFLRAFLYFLTILPAVIFSAFITGCAVQWSDAGDSVARFSSAMTKRYQKVMIFALAIAFILSLCQEAFVPSLKRKLKRECENPFLLQKYIELTQDALEKNKVLVAWQYAQQAFAISPEDKKAAELYALAKDKKDILLEAVKSNENKEAFTVEKIKTPVYSTDASYSVRQLVEKSQEAALEERWFDSHYWASLALKACSGTDTNLSVAQQCANRAWNKLSNPVRFDNDEAEEFFKQKKEGYLALKEGDNLKAYYIFTALSEKSVEYASDPDVKRYLPLAREKVESEYFFIDETDDVLKNADARNILFKLPHADGSSDVIFIKSAASMKNAGEMIRYLEGLSIISYDKDGNFIQQMSVPFAKMYEQSVDVLDKEKMAALGITKDYKTVPYIFLQSVDRTTEGIVAKPVYSYKISGLPAEIAEKISSLVYMVPDKQVKDVQLSSLEKQMYISSNAIILPMPYRDFSVINDAASGPEKMPLFSLLKFAPKSSFYGYSFEVFSQNLVERCVFPLLILILIVFSAACSWNYRINENEMFKFKWLFMFPIFTIVNFILLDTIFYFFKFINYFFVAYCSAFALVLCAVFYMLLFVAVSVFFLARKK